MTKQSIPKFATLANIAEIVERNPSSLSRICHKASIKPRRSDGLYQVSKVMAAMEEAAKRDLRNTPQGAAGNLKDQKLLEEIGILKVKRAELEKRLIPMDEHLSEMRTLASWFNDSFALWISGVKVLTADARVVAEAERLRDECRANVGERIKSQKE